MLPRVNIQFANGALGQVETMADSSLGFVALGAAAVAAVTPAPAGETPTPAANGAATPGFELGRAYVIRKLADLEALGVTAENNPLLHRNVKEFYAEAGDGAEAYVMGLAETSLATVLDKDTAAGARKLIEAAAGKLRGIIAFKSTTATVTPKDGLDPDVAAALTKAQGLGVWATETLHAPLFVLLEGYGFTGNALDLAALTTMDHNRVGVVVGDTIPDSPNAAVGVVAGRIAASPVERKISRVRDGALRAPALYIGSRPVEQADVETIHERGYITFRTFVGRSGCYIADDTLATRAEDDYRSLTNRRVVDKAYRIAYNALLDELNAEIPIASDGSLAPAWCAALRARIEQAVAVSMAGNLGNDPSDADDRGVECSVDYRQPVLQTGRLVVGLRVKPNGYARYIDVELGFKTA